MASFVRGTPQSAVNQYYQNNPWDARGTPTMAAPSQQQPSGGMSVYKSAGPHQYTPPQQGSQAPNMGAYSRPPFQFGGTDFMGNTFDNPTAMSNQRGAMTAALHGQRGQQIGDLFSRGTPLTNLDPTAAYARGQQMLQDGWQNPFMDPSLLGPQAPPTMYQPPALSSDPSQRKFRGWSPDPGLQVRPAAGQQPDRGIQMPNRAQPIQPPSTGTPYRPGFTGAPPDPGLRAAPDRQRSAFDQAAKSAGLDSSAMGAAYQEFQKRLKNMGVANESPQVRQLSAQRAMQMTIDDFARSQRNQQANAGYDRGDHARPKTYGAPQPGPSGRRWDGKQWVQVTPRSQRP